LSSYFQLLPSPQAFLVLSACHRHKHQSPEPHSALWHQRDHTLPARVHIVDLVYLADIHLITTFLHLVKPAIAPFRV